MNTKTTDPPNAKSMTETNAHISNLMGLAEPTSPAYVWQCQALQAGAHAICIVKQAGGLLNAEGRRAFPELEPTLETAGIWMRDTLLQSRILSAIYENAAYSSHFVSDSDSWKFWCAEWPELPHEARAAVIAVWLQMQPRVRQYLGTFQPSIFEVA